MWRGLESCLHALPYGPAASAEDTKSKSRTGDSTDIELIDGQVHGARAGWGDPVDANGPTEPPKAVAFKVSEDAERVVIDGGCATGLSGVAGEWFLLDDSGSAEAASACPAGGYA